MVLYVFYEGFEGFELEPLFFEPAGAFEEAATHL